MPSVALICEPRYESHSLSNMHTVLNLNIKQIDNLFRQKEKFIKALRGSGSVEREEDISFWLESEPDPVDQNWQEEEGLPSSSDGDLQWRYLPDVVLDEDKMNMDLVRLEVTTLHLNKEGIYFSAYVKHNPTRYETGILSWKELAKLQKKLSRLKVLKSKS